MVLNHWVLGTLHFKIALWSHLHGSKCPRRFFFNVLTLWDVVLKHQALIIHRLSITFTKNMGHNQIASKAWKLVQNFILDIYFASMVFNILLLYFTLCKVSVSCWMYCYTQVARLFITPENVSSKIWDISFDFHSYPVKVLWPTTIHSTYYISP